MYVLLMTARLHCMYCTFSLNVLGLFKDLGNINMLAYILYIQTDILRAF